jgi:hypothetical protein
MKFLKLLDPRDCREGTGLSVGAQQNLASQRFPALVAKSRLHYWRPGYPIPTSGTRILAGLAASFSLLDLRFADVLNEALGYPTTVPLQVDVFNLQDDVTAKGSLAPYFPGLRDPCVTTPVIGIWKDGVHQGNWIGGKGIDVALEILNVPLTVADLARSLEAPIRPELMED